MAVIGNPFGVVALSKRLAFDAPSALHASVGKSRRPVAVNGTLLT